MSAIELEIVAQTGGPFMDFTPCVPSISESGVVAFRALLLDGRAVMVLVDGDGTDIVCDQPPIRSVNSHPALSSGGYFSCYAELDTGQSALLLGERGRCSVTVASGDRFVGIGPLGPTMNDSNEVAFRAALADGVESICVWREARFQVIASSGRQFAEFHGLPVIDGHGHVLFRADLIDGGEAIYRWEQDEDRELVRTGDRFASIRAFPSSNRHGSVVFAATQTNGVSGLFLLDADRIRTWAESAQGFESFRGALITESGEVVFYATPDGGELGIYSGGRRVTGIGDQFAGSRVADLALNPVSMNEKGDFVFRLALEDGRQMIVRSKSSA